MSGSSGLLELTIADGVRVDLFERVLPFWMATVRDGRRHGLHGAVDADGRVRRGAARSTVLASRVAWTFAAVYRRTGDLAALHLAERAGHELSERHTDDRRGGVWWSIDSRRRPLVRYKHAYAQSFAIYAYTELWLATQNPQWQRAARDIITLLRAHLADGRGGFAECASEQWEPESGRCLGLSDPGTRISTNTMLHVVEALANAVRAGLGDLALVPLREHLVLLSTHAVQPDVQGMYQWFGRDWQPMGDTDATSPGHDLEAAWLLADAAQLVDDPGLRERVESVGLGLAHNALRRGLSPDGGIVARIGGADPDPTLHWWAQAEGLAGLCWAAAHGDQRFTEAGLRLWALIESRFASRGIGDWARAVGSNGQPHANRLAVGPWECPYHVARTELGVLERAGVLPTPVKVAVPPRRGQWYTR